jgi:hypothetical protein
MDGHWCYWSIGHGAQAICYVSLSIDNIPGLQHDTIYQTGHCRDADRSGTGTEIACFTTAPFDIAQYRAEYCLFVDGIWIYVATDVGSPAPKVVVSNIVIPEVATPQVVTTDVGHTYMERLMLWIYNGK